MVFLLAGFVLVGVVCVLFVTWAVGAAAHLPFVQAVGDVLGWLISHLLLTVPLAVVAPFAAGYVWGLLTRGSSRRAVPRSMRERERDRQSRPVKNGFTVTQFADKVRAMTGQTDNYTTRHASYDLRKIRGKQLVDKPGRTRRYHVPPKAACTIAALLTLRDHVIAPAHRRRPQPTPRTQTQHLDPGRPRLRNHPHRPTNPLPSHRHHHTSSRRIDNNLSIRSRKFLAAH